MFSNLNVALISFLKKVHKKDKRRNGTSYYKHPVRVAEYVKSLGGSDQQIKVALFHDSIEMHDNIELRSRLKRLNIFEQVLILSHRHYESYQDYIEKVAEYPDLIMVKICDIIDNLCDNPSEKQKGRYRDALLYLLKKI